jgi:flagellar biosynthesis GTPase FlhF
MGKLATQLVTQQKQKVTLAGLDFQRMAAHEELSSYADILQVDVTDNIEKMTDGGEKSDTITLIDAPDLPTDPQKFDGLKKRVETINPNYRVAVFSVLTRSSDIEQQANRIKPLAPTHIAMTMLDQTSRYGAILAAVRTLGVKVAWITDSPGGIGQARIPDPENLAHALLPMGVTVE